MTPDELQVIARLDGLVFRQETVAAIEGTAAILAEQLSDKPSAPFVRRELPLELFGPDLPDGILSSNIYVIRPLVSSGLERHPNSHQRSMTFRGRGVFELGVAAQKQEYAISGASPAERWVSIPPNTWHQALAGSEPWTVVTFHTATDRDIINERM